MIKFYSGIFVDIYNGCGYRNEFYIDGFDVYVTQNKKTIRPWIFYNYGKINNFYVSEDKVML